MKEKVNKSQIRAFESAKYGHLVGGFGANKWGA